MRESIQELLREARAAIPGESAGRDAQILLARVLARSRAFLRAYPEHCPDAVLVAEFRQLVARRRAGEPVAFITGEREFWSLPLMVTRDTLVPRPETELVVEVALNHLPQGESLCVLDLGTGTGAIALALASERPECAVTATDASAPALEVARRNAAKLRLGNVSFALGDWWQAVPAARFHLIASNPPYVADDDPHLARGDLPAEPRAALAGGADGLRDLRHIIAGARPRLETGGRLVLEHGYDQRAAVRAALHAHGFQAIVCHRDLAGLDRVTEALAR